MLDVPHPRLHRRRAHADCRIPILPSKDPTVPPQDLRGIRLQVPHDIRHRSRRWKRHQKMNVVLYASDGNDVDSDVARNLSREMPDPLWIANKVAAVLGPVHAVHKVLRVGSSHSQDAVKGEREDAPILPSGCSSTM